LSKSDDIFKAFSKSFNILFGFPVIVCETTQKCLFQESSLVDTFMVDLVQTISFLGNCD
jgi:hypothetical protein